MQSNTIFLMRRFSGFWGYFVLHVGLSTRAHRTDHRRSAGRHSLPASLCTYISTILFDHLQVSFPPRIRLRSSRQQRRETPCYTKDIPSPSASDSFYHRRTYTLSDIPRCIFQSFLAQISKFGKTWHRWGQLEVYAESREGFDLECPSHKRPAVVGPEWCGRIPS